jgi:hypothetical protein
VRLYEPRGEEKEVEGESCRLHPHKKTCFRLRNDKYNTRPPAQHSLRRGRTKSKSGILLFYPSPLLLHLLSVSEPFVLSVPHSWAQEGKWYKLSTNTETPGPALKCVSHPIFITLVINTSENTNQIQVRNFIGFIYDDHQ